MKIVFEFFGGPNDGKVLQGKLGEPSDAERYYLFTITACTTSSTMIGGQVTRIDTMEFERGKETFRDTTDVPH